MPVFDYNLMFISSGNLTKTALYPSSGIKIHGTPVKGMGVRIYFPSTKGTSVKVLPEIHLSQDNSTYHQAAVYPGGAQSWASGAKELIFAFEASQRKYRYVKLKFTITNGTTGTSFGAVKAGLVLPGSGEFDRTVDWT